MENISVKIDKIDYRDTEKPVSKGHSQKDRKSGFKTNYRLMQVKSIAECSKGSILQYFRPSLSYHLSLRSLFCLFLSGHFTQVLLYCKYRIFLTVLFLRITVKDMFAMLKIRD